MSGKAAANLLNQAALKPYLPKPTHYRAAAGWAGAAGMGALWLVQPFDWMKKTFIAPEEQEEK